MAGAARPKRAVVMQVGAGVQVRARLWLAQRSCVDPVTLQAEWDELQGSLARALHWAQCGIASVRLATARPPLLFPRLQQCQGGHQRPATEGGALPRVQAWPLPPPRWLPAWRARSKRCGRVVSAWPSGRGALQRPWGTGGHSGRVRSHRFGAPPRAAADPGDPHRGSRGGGVAGHAVRAVPRECGGRAAGPALHGGERGRAHQRTVPGRVGGGDQGARWGDGAGGGRSRRRPLARRRRHGGEASSAHTRPPPPPLPPARRCWTWGRATWTRCRPAASAWARRWAAAARLSQKCCARLKSCSARCKPGVRCVRVLCVGGEGVLIGGLGSAQGRRHSACCCRCAGCERLLHTPNHSAAQ